MQVASYEILKTMAQAAGENSIASTCEECRAEQLEFAEWLDQQIPQFVMRCMAN
jgi:ferritin-like metal-binding protein YciE